MTPSLDADEQKQLLYWLQEQGGAVKRSSLFLSVLAILSFLLRLAVFWQIALSLQLLLVKTQKLPFSLLFSLILLFALILAIERLRLYLSERTEKKLYQTIQTQLFERFDSGQFALIRQKPTYFWQQLWLTHIPAITQFNLRYLVQQRFAAIVPFIILLCAFPINWLVGLSLLVSLPVVPMFMIVIGKGVASLHRKHFNALTRLGSLFVDRVKALESLQIFSAHDSQTAVLETASNGLNQRTMKVVGVAFLSSTVLDFFSTLAVALVAVFVGFNLLGEFTLGGQLDLHTGLFLLLAVPLCFAELKQLGKLYHLRAEAIAAAADLAPILTAPQENTISVDANNFTSVDWMQFKVNTPPILSQKLSFKQGDWIRLKGESGSGKTCLLESLLGQRAASHSIKNAVLLNQQSIILPSTIKQNLSLDREYKTDVLQSVIQKVELDDWLKSQANGLDTLLDEQIPLSGGQKQRLALARVLLLDANIILLDEPTAHLTHEQHLRLSKIIRQLFIEKTVIWASHKSLPDDWFNKHWQLQNGQVIT